MDRHNEIWDEFQWEEFMRGQDKKVERYMELFFRHKDDPRRDRIIAGEMGWDWLTKSGGNAGLPGEEEPEELEEGDEWKRAAGVDGECEPFDSLALLPAYRSSKDFALRALRFVEQLPDALRADSAVVDFLSNAMIAPAKIAGGSGMGDDVEELGGNIAYCKRALAASNLSLAALAEMKEKEIVRGAAYREFLGELTEVRNLIATRILELREKFRRLV